MKTDKNTHALDWAEDYGAHPFASQRTNVMDEYSYPPSVKTRSKPALIHHIPVLRQNPQP